MDADVPKILIIDDDPIHLEIYSLILENANFKPVPVQVNFAGLEFPSETGIASIVLDYCLNSAMSPAEVAQEATTRFPDAQIIVLSDLWSMPADVAPYVTKFVRKGEPQRLIDALAALLPRGPGMRA